MFGSESRLRPHSFVLVVALLGGCTDPLLQPLPNGAVIVAYGDSLTAGSGVERRDAYPAVLQSMVGHTVRNEGVSGETTAQGLKRLPGVLDRNRPDLLILLEGGNDILRNMDLADTERNLDRMITLARERDIAVVLIGVPKRSLFSNTATLYHDLAERHGVPLEDSIIASLLRKSSMKSDSVHFNRAGYRALAQGVQELLVKHSALR